MNDILIAGFFGLLSGMLTGLMPGVSISLGFLLFLPLVPLNALCILLYAIVSRIGSQFFGSISVFYFRLPGETSSYPVLLELKNFKFRNIQSAVVMTNVGSLFATVFAIAVFYLIMNTNVMDNIYVPILGQLLVYLFLLGVALFANGAILLNLTVIGLCTIVIFYPQLAAATHTYSSALPVYYFNTHLILIILFLSQMLWQVQNKIQKIPTATKTKKIYKKYFGKMSFYSMVGCVMGLIPQLGTTLSSYISYSIEKFRKKPAMHRMIASETANNGAAITGWLPLLVFGIPIYASEIILLQYFQQFNFNFNFLRENNTILTIAGVSVGSAIIFFVLATILNQKIYINMGKMIFQKWFAVLLIVISLGCFYYVNQYDLNYLSYHCLIFTPVGYLIHRYKMNMLTLVIGLLLTEDIIENTIRAWQIYQ